MNLKSLLTAVTAAALVATSLVALGGATAYADGVCPANNVAKQYGQFWQASGTNYISGYRAPIVLRRDGLLCTGSGNYGSFVSPWIGAASLNTNGLSQIGWDHESGIGYCRFWESINGFGGDSGPVDYDCGDDSDGTIRWFKTISEVDPNDQLVHWELYDCDSSYTNCVRLSYGPKDELIGPVYGDSSMESYFGESGLCSHYRTKDQSDNKLEVYDDRN